MTNSCSSCGAPLEADVASCPSCGQAPGEAPAQRRYLLRRDSAEPRYRIDYHQELNPAQYQAVAHRDGPALVIAGAGSGKTRTLIYRVARLVESGVDPRQILLLTFTRRAAGEMLRRAGAMLDQRCEAVAGGTFHSFAHLVLRRQGMLLGLSPRFTILDEGDAEDAINLLRAQAGLNSRERRFPRKQTIRDMFSKSVNQHRPLLDVLEEEYPHFIHHLADLEQLQSSYTAYKRQRSLVDYDDLLVLLIQLLSEHPGVREQLAAQYRYLMVDEYQDTNVLQARIVQLLAAHGNVMVVGDDSQCVYGFRGANFRNIMDFPRQFSDTRIITLEENYRSTQAILNVANVIIEQALEKYPKRLYTRQGAGELPALVQARDEAEQSLFVAQRVLELREEGIPLHDIAVLFRSSYLSFDLELELAKRDIPYVKYGGFQFFEAAHIKDLIAHLRILANPQDAISWNRVLLLVEGIGPRASQRLIDALISADDPFALSRRHGGGRGALGLARLEQALRQLHSGAMAPAEQLQLLLDYYYPLLQERYDDYPRRRRDLEHLVVLAEKYRSSESFLADLALEPPNRSQGGILAPQDDELPLVLSTIHSAKGLEWQAVFIIWALDGRLPSQYSVQSPQALDEERRLFYVAVTRAKRHLYLTYPINIFDRGSQLLLSDPSRFVKELPTSSLERWTLTPPEE